MNTSDLTTGLDVVGRLVDGVRDDQWSAPTPCTEWTVRDLVNHLVGMNLVFTALLTDQAPPERGSDRLGDDPVGAYRTSGDALVAACSAPGVLDRTIAGPLGTASGADRLNIRIADLLAHGWDLAQATGQSADLPEELSEQSLAFLRVQLDTMPRTSRFDPAQPVADDAPALDRLAAFVGRKVT
jgi:uncharacterized protein (TIGR03086 family)